MSIISGMLFGFAVWFVVRYGLAGIYTVNQDQRAVLTSFGRAERVAGRTVLDDAIGEQLQGEERDRYAWPQVRVIPPGGPYWKWPWQRVYKVSVATMTANMAWDPEFPDANGGGTVLEGVTKDQLNINLTGQIRYRVSERNLYAYLFGVKHPIAHVMGYFVSVLRERIANFEAPANDIVTGGISINDLRKNLRDLNEHMDHECASSQARYGMVLDASLITGIDPPQEVESALAAINTAHNQVSSDISLAQASADQKLVESRRAVEIETLRAEAEAEPIRSLATQMVQLKQSGPNAVTAYMRNARLALLALARHVIREDHHS